jgi:hypothetical protein
VRRGLPEAMILLGVKPDSDLSAIPFVPGRDDVS